MLISVIIPIYKSGKTALNAFKSVVNQTPKYDYEVIFVDDFSNDNSIEFLKRNIKDSKNIKIKYFTHTLNKGAGAARNTALKHVTGKYFAFLDSDDVWLDDKMIKQVEFLEDNPNYSMVGCLTNMPGSFPPFFLKKKKNININVIHQCFKNYFQTSTVVISTKKFNKVTKWSLMRYGDEGDAFLKITKFYNANLLNEVLVNYADGKRGFGFSGVSSNLKGMQDAEIKNLKMAYRNGLINVFIFAFSVIFSYFKYFLRIIRTRLN